MNGCWKREVVRTSYFVFRKKQTKQEYPLCKMLHAIFLDEIRDTKYEILDTRYAFYLYERPAIHHE